MFLIVCIFFAVCSNQYQELNFGQLLLAHTASFIHKKPRENKVAGSRVTRVCVQTAVPPARQWATGQRSCGFSEPGVHTPQWEGKTGDSQGGDD